MSKKHNWSNASAKAAVQHFDLGKKKEAKGKEK